MLTYQKKKVHNINLSLCEENYSPLEIVDQLKIIKSKTNTTEKKKIKQFGSFRIKKRSIAGRQNTSNAIKTKPGLSKF